MPANTASAAASRNRFLRCLPPDEFRRLQPNLQHVPLRFKQILNEPGSAVDHVYFLMHGVASAIFLMEDGTGIEVATIGNEGVVGIAAFFGEAVSVNRIL